MNQDQTSKLNNLQISKLAESGICITYAELPLYGKSFQSPHWVQAVAALVDAAIRMSEKREFENWQSEVSSQLERILDGLAAIQQELRELRVWFDERITEETRRQYHQRIESVSRDVSLIVGAIGRQENVPTQGQIDDLNYHFRDLRITIDSLASSDEYTHIMGVIAGVVAALPLFTLLSRKTERSEWAKRLHGFFNEAIAVNNPKSIEFARNSIASEYVAAKGEFDRLCNSYWTTNFEPAQGIERPAVPEDAMEKGGGSGGRSRRTFIKQMASGDLNAGIALGYRSGIEVGEGPPWYPHLSARWRIYSGPDVSWSEMYKDIESKRLHCVYLGKQVANLSGTIAQIRDIATKLSSVFIGIPSEGASLG